MEKDLKQLLAQSLKMIAGRDSQGNALETLKGYSTTVVKQAFTENKPVIVTGTDQGRALGSESAVMHNLRSIMAVPLKVHDKPIGVVYLDSHLAKGLFTADDIELLSMLANNIAVAFELSNKAKMELEKANLKRELDVQSAIANESKKVKILVDHMQQALFSVAEGGVVVEPVSKYSEKVLGMNVVGKKILPLFFKDDERQKANRDSMSSAIATVFGEDELQWGMMESNIPRKIHYLESEKAESGTHEKVLKINSSPIWNDQGNLERILFVVEDISDLEALEKKLSEQSEQALILESILENELEDSYRFLSDLVSSLGKCLKMTEGLSEAGFTTIIRDLHTFKGNARLYKLVLIAEQIHHSESKLEDFKRLPRDYEAISQVLNTEINSIVNVVSRFQTVLNKVYKPESQLRASDSAMASKIALDQLSEIASRLHKFLPPEESKSLIAGINRLGFKSVRGMIVKFEPMVKDLAKRLNKNVNFGVLGDALTSSENLEALSDCLLHLVRNSLDHGLEESSERTQSGKSETGIISVECKDEMGVLTVNVSDDGRGIDGLKVAASALRKGLIDSSTEATLSLDEKVQLIFLPNFSTKESATEISGRGVGMDIVKSRIQELNGELTVSTILGKGSVFRITLRS